MPKPREYTVAFCGRTITLPVVQLEGAPLSIALADTLGDWQLCDTLADCLIERAEARGLTMRGAGALLTAGKAVTLAQCLARRLGIASLAVAEKQAKSFWQDAYVVPSRSITGGRSEQLTLGGRRADMLRGASILVVDDVISTGESIHALTRIAAHYGRVAMVAAPFMEGSDGSLPDAIEGYPAVTLAHLPIWMDE